MYALDFCVATLAVAVMAALAADETAPGGCLAPPGRTNAQLVAAGEAGLVSGLVVLAALRDLARYWLRTLRDAAVGRREREREQREIDALVGGGGDERGHGAVVDARVGPDDFDDFDDDELRGASARVDKSVTAVGRV